MPVSAYQESERKTWFDVYADTYSDEVEEEDEYGMDKVRAPDRLCRFVVVFGSVAQMTVKLHELLDHETSRCDSHRVFVAGVAEGGAMALHSGYARQFQRAILNVPQTELSKAAGWYH